MLDIGFYHCTRASVLEVAVKLAAKAYESGARLLIVGAADQLPRLDTMLWTHSDGSFLPHAIEGKMVDAEQPILLAPALNGPEAANGARLLMLLETGLMPGFEGFDRVFNLFEHNGSAHQRARDDWKALSGREGMTRSYWQQKETGGWEKKL